MNDSEQAANQDATSTAGGFQISARPLVGAPSDHPVSSGARAEGLPATYGTDLLYVIARDPGTLFLYWDLNWARAFAQAGLSPRQVHLRIYRDAGSIEGTREINPFRGHCYVEVAAGGTSYYCELGCFEGKEWHQLVRSGTTSTPESAMSDDLSADFATLPLHLSFQRLLEVFESNNSHGKSLAHSVAELQENAREDWSQALAAQNGGNGEDSAAIASLLESAQRSAKRGDLTPEQLARWKQLSERLAGSSWGGASERAGLGEAAARPNERS